MDTTATFTLRKNAKRAAEAMIRKGTAPAIDYSIKHSDDGRFEIVWKIAKTAPTIGEVETEIAEASADQPAASEAEPAPQLAPAATEPAMTDAAPQPASEAKAASQPALPAAEPGPALREPTPTNEWPQGTRVMGAGARGLPARRPFPRAAARVSKPQTPPPMRQPDPHR
jgi:hypothetical protein